MQFRFQAAAIVFLGSYLPLSLILLAQDYNYDQFYRPICWRWMVENSNCVMPFRNPTFSLGIFIVCLACFGITLLVLKLTPTKRTVEVVEARYISSDLMNYTLPYVVSFMSIEYHDTGKFVGLVIFLGWMFWITHRSGLIILNPILIAFGWRLYDLTYKFAGDQKPRTGTALSNGKIFPGETTKYTTLQDVLIIKKSIGTETQHVGS